MREIIELNRQILAELPENFQEGAPAVICRETGPKLWPDASPAVKEAAEAVHVELNRHVPEDFGYTVSLGDEQPRVRLS
jgi:hypothetical protein